MDSIKLISILFSVLILAALAGIMIYAFDKRHREWHDFVYSPQIICILVLGFLPPLLIIFSVIFSRTL